MPTITALRVQKRNKQRVNVFLDEQFAFGLTLNEALQLKVGETLTPADIERLKAADEVGKAYERAVRFLAYRPRSVAEVRRNLVKHGVAAAVSESVIERLRESGALNDDEFARFWIENRLTFRPRGSRALRAELRQKGVAADVIGAALGEVDEHAAARTAAERRSTRLLGLSAPEFRRKLSAYLARRGFDYTLTAEIVTELIAELDLNADTESED